MDTSEGRNETNPTMAKKAGAKNSGAWQRFNNFITTADPGQVAAVAEAWSASAAIENALGIITNTLNQYGIPIPSEMQSLDGWTAYWAQFGVPYDMWIGYVGYDFYDPAGKGKYKPILRKPVSLAAEDVRYIARLAQFGDTQAARLAYNGGKHHKNPVPPAGLAAPAEADPNVAVPSRAEQIAQARAARRAAKLPVMSKPPKAVKKNPLTA